MLCSQMPVVFYHNVMQGLVKGCLVKDTRDTVWLLSSIRNYPKENKRVDWFKIVFLFKNVRLWAQGFYHVTLDEGVA